jgi:hypothetical protein
MMFACVKSVFLSSKIVFQSFKLNTNESKSIAKFKCVGINANCMIFVQPYETSPVIFIDFCTNKNEGQWSEAQTLLIFLCNFGLSKIKQFLNF